MSTIYVYRCLGESFPSPADALSYARNMGLTGPITMRAYRVRVSL